MKIKKRLFSLLKESAYKQLDSQNSSVQSIEAKTNTLLTAILALVAILVTILITSNEAFHWNILLALGGLSLFISIFFSMKSLLCRDFTMPAEIEPFLAENRNLPLNKVYLNFLDDCRKSIKLNIGRLKDKGRNFNYSLILFVFSIALIIGGIIQGRWFIMTNNDQQQPNTQPQQTQPSPTPSPNIITPPTEPQDSGLPTDRQGTTINIFKGSEEKTTKGGL